MLLTENKENNATVSSKVTQVPSHQWRLTMDRADFCQLDFGRTFVSFTLDEASPVKFEFRS